MMTAHARHTHGTKVSHLIAVGERERSGAHLFDLVDLEVGDVVDDLHHLGVELAELGTEERIPLSLVVQLLVELLRRRLRLLLLPLQDRALVLPLLQRRGLHTSRPGMNQHRAVAARTHTHHHHPHTRHTTARNTSKEKAHHLLILFNLVSMLVLPLVALLESMKAQSVSTPATAVKNTVGGGRGGGTVPLRSSS